MQAEVMLKKTIDYLSGHLPGFAELIVKIVHLRPDLRDREKADREAGACRAGHAG